MVRSIKPVVNAHTYLAYSFYQLKQYEEALLHIKKVIEISHSYQIPIRESRLQLKLKLVTASGDTVAATNTLLRLAEAFPNKRNLWALAITYFRNGEGWRSLLILDCLYYRGELDTKRDLMIYIYQLVDNGNFDYAGVLMEHAMNTGVVAYSANHIVFLNQIWSASITPHRQIPVLAKSNSGDTKSPGFNFILQGMAEFNQERFEAALNSFRRAKLYQPSLSDAEKWEKYVLEEMAGTRD